MYDLAHTASDIVGVVTLWRFVARRWHPATLEPNENFGAFSFEQRSNRQNGLYISVGYTIVAVTVNKQTNLQNADRWPRNASCDRYEMKPQRPQGGFDTSVISI